MKTIILNIFSRILKLCRCVFLLDVYLFYVLMYVLQEIFPPWHIPFNIHVPVGPRDVIPFFPQGLEGFNNEPNNKGHVHL